MLILVSFARIFSSPGVENGLLGLGRKDKDLEQALEGSRRVGDLLLKREHEELAAIDKLAAELIQKEYRQVLQNQYFLGKYIYVVDLS